MIVSFSVSNFRSFAAEETFSLVASNRLGASHENHAVPIPDSKEKVLRTAVLYGANGAGKSNLFKALRYLRAVALDIRPKDAGMGREAFRFDGWMEQPSSFDLQFIVQDKLYRYGIRLNDRRILEEWLVHVVRGREKTLYERITDEEGKVSIDAEGLKESGGKLQALATVGGPQNQSFLATVRATLDASDIGEPLGEICAWFMSNLRLVGAGESLDSVEGLLTRDSEFADFAGEFLRASSTGVDHLEVVKAEVAEDKLPWGVSKNALSSLPPMFRVKGDTGDALFLVERNGGDRLYRVTIHAAHKHTTENSVALELVEESDGTRRLLELMPALHQTRARDDVFFVDEIDRSLHPMLVWKFLQFFLTSCTGSPSQIIVTTHESNLLDLELLRRDEIWFTEKDPAGATRLYSMVDFKVRTDLEIRKHYLQGRFGAIPFLGNLDRLMEEKGQSG